MKTGRRFRNNFPHDRHGFGDFLKFLVKWQRQPWERMRFPVVTPDPAVRTNRSEPMATWIGHSTFLVQLGGFNVLTDPHFTGRASPFSFAGPERLTGVGMALAELPPVDTVLISHNHYDHLDEGSVRSIAKAHPKALFVVPLGVKEWFDRRRIGNVVELDWWQAHEGKGFKVTCVPAQHFSGRSASDRNATLWCGLVFEAAGRKVYFAGDTGYSKDFAEIGKRLAPIDLALLPIGAYAPRWFMRAMHVNPEEAVAIHRDVGSLQSIAMHWGTFRLTEEPLDEPPLQLKTALAKAGVPAAKFWVLQHGETRRF